MNLSSQCDLTAKIEPVQEKNILCVN
jgi:hypothetical protein